MGCFGWDTSPGFVACSGSEVRKFIRQLFVLIIHRQTCSAVVGFSIDAIDAT
jgi:hypothetical protein